MSEWFHVGQRVECIDASDPTPEDGPPPFPVFGAVYTVANIYVDSLDTAHPGALMLELVELPSPELWSPDGTRWSAGFIAANFRPLRKRTTSIEVFKRLLVTPPKVGVDA